ncbi:hypothetical protein FRZ61_34560 [Hypericibacter adhaerens]|uniref:Uncharacterized protein n=1 Tax=Hypericibacter adhaerens TaxID=2602016 RepID=A0A5J6N0J7_9PROT|nr:hypothetical protein FRZ61_34560 [Hypericibacter adhaerens]
MKCAIETWKLSASAMSDRASEMTGIRSSTAFDATAARLVRETAAMPFRAGKMLALTDSSPHLWFSP